MPLSYWLHALLIAFYLHNILPSKSLTFYSPTQVLYWRNPSYSHLRVFGCLCYPHLSSTTSHKLQARSLPCVFLGFPTNHRGYLCLDLSTNKILTSHHVTFDEHSFPFSKTHTPTCHSYDFLSSEPSPYLSHYIPHAANVGPKQTPNATAPSSPPPANTSPAAASPPHVPMSPIQFGTLGSPSPLAPPRPQPPLPSHSMVTRGSHGIFKPRVPLNLSASTLELSFIPKSPLLALRYHNWKMAVTDEYNAPIKNETWDLMPRPPNVNVI